jgi:hypothetical protein
MRRISVGMNMIIRRGKEIESGKILILSIFLLVPESPAAGISFNSFEVILLISDHICMVLLSLLNFSMSGQ